MIPISAKVEATFGIKGEIPSSVMGRLFNLFADIISPISEARGEKGDLIRQRRQVQEVVCQKVIEKIAQDQISIKQIESKNIQIILEKSSYEDLNDQEMIDRWSALLLNASTTSKFQPRFAQILHEINGRQAVLFQEKAIAHLDSFGDTDVTMADTHLRVEARRIGVAVQKILSSSEFSGEPNDSFDEVQACVEGQGCFLIQILYYSDIEDMSIVDYIDLQHQGNPEIKIDTEILGSIGLLERHVLTIGKDEYLFEVSFYSVTELGIKFFKIVDTRFLSQKQKLI